MNALADAAFLSSGRADVMMPPPLPDGAPNPYASTPYSEQEMQAMGLLNGAGGLPQPVPGSMPPPLPPLPAGVRSLVPAPQLPGPGRHLQILDHTVHRIDAHTKANGEEEKEMVVPTSGTST